jgi:hypothetical protein
MHQLPKSIVGDGCTCEEHAMGWYYYLDGTLSFPFMACCVAKSVNLAAEKAA